MRRFCKMLLGLVCGGLILHNGAQAAPLIGLNSHGHDVVILQQTLQKLNYKLDDSRGQFGLSTEQALKEFQRERKLPVTGRVDRATWQEIEKAKWGGEKAAENKAAVKIVKPGVTPEAMKPASGNYPQAKTSQKKTSKTKQKTTKKTGSKKPAAAKKPVNISWDNLSSVPMGKEIISAKEAEAIIKTAKQYLGAPYVFGGNTPGGFDCSGYLEYVFAQHKMKIPRTADVQYELGRSYPVSKLNPGDLVFFTTYESGVSHCGIYLGNRQFIHASTSRGVVVDSLDADYWVPRFYGGKKIVK